MKVDLNFDLVDLEGVLISKANKIIAGLLMSEMKGDSVKLFDWAVSFSKDGIVEMDAADLESFKSLLKTTERISVMAKAPIIKYINELKNAVPQGVPKTKTINNIEVYGIDVIITTKIVAQTYAGFENFDLGFCPILKTETIDQALVKINTYALNFVATKYPNT